MRIGIVNDLPLAVECLRQILLKEQEHDVIWVAENGAEAVKLCTETPPDLLLMDLIMPVMNGVDATRRIMQSTPCPILIVTASVDAHSSKVFEAMGAGALDVVATPKDSNTGKTLLQKIALIGKVMGIKQPPKKNQRVVSDKKQLFPSQNNCLIAIGCSTGGPQALITALSSLPADFPASIVVIQHMDQQFTAGLAEWLAKQLNLRVRILAEGDRPTPGTVLVPSTDNDVVLTTGNTFNYKKKSEDSFYHPSADIFFKSIATYWQQSCIGILLTGMGKDGAEGLLAIRQRGWYTIAQDESSSVVYGMPKAAKQMNAADIILPANAIGPALIDLLAPNCKTLNGNAGNENFRNPL